MKNQLLFVLSFLFMTNFLMSQSVNSIPGIQNITLKPSGNELPVNPASDAMYNSEQNKAVIFTSSMSNNTQWTVSNEPNVTLSTQWVRIADTSLASTKWKQYVGPYMGSATPMDGVYYFDGITNLANAVYGLSNSKLTNTTAISTMGHPSVKIKFYQLYKGYNGDSTLLEISSDNVNWYTLDVNPTITANQYAYGWKEYNISPWAANKAQVWIRFRFFGPATFGTGPQFGGGYGWMIDDVTVEDNLANSLIFDKIWLFDGYSQVPVQQNKPISFEGRVENFGSATQTNVKLNAKELNTNTIFSNSSPQTLLPTQIDTIILDSIVLPNIAGTYNIAPYISSDNISQLAYNDTINVNLNNNNLFSRDNNFYSSSRWNNGDGCTIATMYQVKQAATAYSLNFVVSLATTVNSYVKAVLYRGATTYRTIITESDYYAIQASNIPLNTGPNPPSITLPFLTSVVLDPDSTYWAGISMNGSTDTVKIAVDNTAQLQNYYTETIFDFTDNKWYVWSFDQQYPSMIRLNLSAPTISVSPSVKNVSSTTGTTQFSVTTNNTWTASSNQTWCTVTPTGSGSGTITANYTTNTTANPRTAIITIIDNTLFQVTVSVIQAGAAVIPDPAGNISGPTSVYKGQSNVTYTVPTIAYATSYLWSLPNGASGTSNTNSITVNFGSSAVSGNISLKGVNSTGNGVASNLYITVNPYVSNCSANFALVADTAVLHHYFVANNATGIPPLHYNWSWGDGTHDTIAFPTHTYSIAGYYNICLTIIDAVGCTVTYCDSTGLQKSPNSIVNLDVIVGTVGLNSLTTDKIKIYPNPAKENLIIDLEKNKAILNTYVSIYDIQGKLLLQQSIEKSQTQLNIANFAKGIYIIKVYNDNNIMQRKFIKE